MFHVKAEREQRENRDKRELAVKNLRIGLDSSICQMTYRPPVPETGQAQTA